jgi:curved DNA-binding protein CbpA
MGNSSSRTQTYQQYYEALQTKQNIQIPSDLSPYDILGVSKNFTWEELKEAYKRQARLVHPDKGGSEQLFNIVTDAFKKLAYDFKLKQQDKQHYELKQNYQNEQPQATYRPNVIHDEHFNDKFNRLFDENKFDDEEESKGYGHMMATSSKTREDIDIPQVMSKFNKTKFNEIFDKQVPVGKDVIIYKEPEPLVLAKKLQFTEIGGTTEDFSTDATKKTGLHYTDYMKAHTTSRLIDPRSIQERKTYKNVEEFESDRASKTQQKLTEEELRYQKEMQIKKEKEEQRRLRRVVEKDERIDKHYQNTSQLFLR